MVKFLNKHLNIYQKELINLDFKDFVAVENVIDRMINSKKEKQHVNKN